MINTFTGLVSPHTNAMLHSSIEVAIRHAMMMAYSRSMKLNKMPQEPDFVAALVLDGSPIIGTQLNAICMAAGGSAKLSGIFCHGKPEVEYSSVGCELGDVLFAHFHTDARGQISRNALLLQAKMSSNLLYSVPRNEHHQLNLYFNWPRFSYKRTSLHLNGQQRDVMPKLPHHGAKYLLIDDSPPTDPQSGLLGLPGTFPMGISPAMMVLDARKPLSYELIDYLSGLTGRKFRESSCNGIGWSAVVWDLIRYSTVKTFNRLKQSDLRNQPRNVTTFAQTGAGFVTSGGVSRNGIMAELFGPRFETWLDGNNDFPPDDNLDIPEDSSENGPSVVLIETSVGRQTEPRE